MTSNLDKKFISYAINLSKKNLGITAPNPVVACVIAKNNEIIATGITAKGGRPHAEKIAIENALKNNQNLSGATIYVTLEPCCHFGQTPPCVDEIIKNKIAKVVIATQDPDKRVNGGGIKKLQDAGIEVVCGVMSDEAKEVNKSFFKAKLSGLPYVTLKLATSLDGKIATKDFDSKWITEEKARYFAHHLRSISDAIMVGANTVKKDNPMLDCRILGREGLSPKRVIIASKLDFDFDAKIFTTAKKIPTKIFTIQKLYDFTRLENLGVEVVFCDEEDGKINIKKVLEKLCQDGVNSLLVEGGQNIATQFLKEGLVDELVWIRSKKIIGNDGVAAVGNLDLVFVKDALNNLIRRQVRELEGDVIEIYKKGV